MSEPSIADLSPEQPDAELVRLRSALEVCGLALHRQHIPIEWLHAAQCASAAGFTDWALADVDDDSPELTKLVRYNLERERR